MKRIIDNLLALFLLLLVAVGCNNSTPNVLGEITINEGYAKKVDIEDFTKGVELPKAGITARYTNGNVATVTSNISYSASKEGEAISSLTVKEKGNYTITATYTEGEVSKSATYAVIVTGPERLLIESLDGVYNYYAGDTYKKDDVQATINYEDMYGNLQEVTSSAEIKIEKDGTEVSENTELADGNYKIIFSYSDEKGITLTAEKSFHVSAGLLPVGFEIVGDAIPETINKDKKETLDLSGLTIKAYYEDGDKKADRELTIISDEGEIEENITLSLSYGETTVSYESGISLESFNKGNKATLTITVPKSFLKAVKTTDNDEVVETTYSGEGLDGNLETAKEILITVNPTIVNGSLKITTNESTEEVPYVENDTVEFKNITFTYDDGTGAEPYTISAAIEGVEVKKGEETVSSPFNLTLGKNTISVTYNEATTETTVEAVEAAKAVKITSIISDLTTRYEVNSATETEISIPDEITMRVEYEDGFEEEITLKDTSKFTFTLTWKTSLGVNALSTPITVTKVNPVKLTTDNVGLYNLSITYSAPEELKHRQEKAFQENTKTKLTYDYSEDIEIIQAAVITNLDVTNSTEEDFKEFVEGDVIIPSDVTFTFINIYGEEDPSKTNASAENFTLYINDTAVTDAGYTLTAEETTYQVKYDDKSGVTATSEEKTISPLPLLTPIRVSINERETLAETINMEDKIDTAYTIENMSVKLTYADDETKDVDIIKNGEIVDDSFTVTIGETPYGEFKYSYDASSLGEQTVTVTLENEKTHSKRQIKEVTETAADLDDTYSITIEREPIIKDAKYTLPEGKTIYNNSRIDITDISFIYVDNHGIETTIHGDNEEATCAINETQAEDETLTIPPEGTEATINVSYKGVESTITISGILADEPAKLLIEESAITTEYKATSPLFSETIEDSVSVEYLSEKVEAIEKNELTFKLGDSTITTETNIVKGNEGASIDVYYDGYKVYTTEAINYNAVESLKVAPKENVPLAIIQTEEAVDAKTFVEKVTLVFEDDTEEDYEGYEFEVTGDTAALRTMVTLTPSVTINGDTVKDQEHALTVQVVANEYERAGYDDALTITGETAVFSIPEVFNRTEDGEAIFFLGYYDEEGTELTYGEGEIYVTTEGEAVLDATNTYPVDYTITNTIHNTKGEEVILHPIYAPVSDYAAFADGVLTDNPELPAISSSIIGIPAEVTTISTEAEDNSPFLDNTSIRMVVFENKTKIEKLYQRAFARMGLKYVDLPDSVTELGLGVFADSVANAEEAYIKISKESQLESIGSYAFSGSNFVNVRIPSNVISIEGATYLNNKYLNMVVIDERENAISLQDGLFNSNEKGLEVIYIPTNVSLSNNTFGGLNVGKIIINDRQNTSSFSDGENTAWGASGNPEIEWLIENIPTADITDEESLKAFLSGSGESVGYIKNSFSTNGFTIGGEKTLIAENSAVITITSPVEDHKGYVVVEGDNISLENITFSLDIASPDNENYLMYVTNAQNLTMDNITLDNSNDNKTTYSTGYFNNVSGNFESLKVSGTVTVPLWFNNCQIILNDYNCDNSGSYDYSRFLLEGTENSLKFTGNITGVLDRFCSTEASGAESYVDFTESNVNSVWTNSSTGTDGDLTWYSYKNN